MNLQVELAICVLRSPPDVIDNLLNTRVRQTTARGLSVVRNLFFANKIILKHNHTYLLLFVAAFMLQWLLFSGSSSYKAKSIYLLIWSIAENIYWLLL